jgi:poly-gamma-glutamate synthesis protein (capsule biosynthesis protein)
MSKKKMYGLLTFIIFTFTLLAIVVIYEFNKYTGGGSPYDQVVSNEEDGNTGEGKNQDEGNEEVTQAPTPSPTTEPEVWEDIKLLFAGDIYLSDYVIKNYDNSGIDGIVSSDMKEFFHQADIFMANQEFTFSTRGTPAADKQYTFRVNPGYVTVFQDMGLDIVTLANNHSLDFGIDAFVDSFDTLTQAGITYTGVGNNLTEAREIKYKEVKGKKLAFLAASRVIPVPEWNATNTKPGMLTTYDPTYLLEDIKQASEESDFVVVYVHWGEEKKETPLDYQRTMAKQYIDAGADLVIGSHPHVLQGIEYYNGKPIVYSLGNFIFYSNINQTAVLEVGINEENQAELKLLPAKAEGAKTSLITDVSAIQKFYEYMKKISFDITFDENGKVLP